MKAIKMKWSWYLLWLSVFWLIELPMIFQSTPGEVETYLDGVMLGVVKMGMIGFFVVLPFYGWYKLEK